jgi:hypothetical protein
MSATRHTGNLRAHRMDDVGVMERDLGNVVAPSCWPPQCKRWRDVCKSGFEIRTVPLGMFRSEHFELTTSPLSPSGEMSSRRSLERLTVKEVADFGSEE